MPNAALMEMLRDDLEATPLGGWAGEMAPLPVREPPREPDDEPFTMPAWDGSSFDPESDVSEPAEDVASEADVVEDLGDPLDPELPPRPRFPKPDWSKP
jgi:hypothetical protein